MDWVIWIRKFRRASLGLPAPTYSDLMARSKPMFVASRVESGDDCKAVLALLPQVIGNIQTAIGCGTLRRASGIAVQVMVGDPVCQGDVIETAADGQIGIRFIDGTVLNLSRGTRVVLAGKKSEGPSGHLEQRRMRIA